MWIACWNCGHDVWIETQKECRNCNEVTHRCGDCSNFLKASAQCVKLNIPINPAEADHPTRLALSSTCTSFSITGEALKRPRQPQGAATGAPTTAARPTVAPAAPATAPAAANHGALGDAEVITIVREPAPRRPKHAIAIAHRGDSGSAPENTLAAFRSAVPNGAQAIEFDVHITRDSHAVVIHDATVDRCSNGTGAVHDLTLAELKALDVGSWFAPEFAGERIPTLDEAIAAIPAPTLLFIHLRAHENETDRCEKAMAEAIARNNIRGRTVVSHHARHSLRRLREMDPKLHLCWIGPGGEPASEYLDDAYYMGYRFVHPVASEIDEALIAYSHEHGMWVNAFWAHEVADMQRLIKLGVDGIITNHPARLRETLAGVTGTA